MVFLIFIIAVYAWQFASGLFQNPALVSPFTNNNTASIYPAANRLFGKLPKSQLTSLLLTEGSKATISLSGGKTLPEFPSSGYVYKINKNQEQLQFAGIARNTATLLGLNSTEDRTENSVMYWQSTENFRTLSFDKINRRWDFELKITNSNLALLTTPLKNDLTYYQQQALSLFGNLGISNTNFNQALSRANYVIYKVDGTLESTVNFSNANFVRVSIFKNVPLIDPKDDSKPVVSVVVRKPGYLDGSVNLIERGNAEKTTQDLVQFKYNEFDYQDTKAIYPLLKAQEAFDLLQNNKGYLYWLKPFNQNLFSDYQQLAVSEFSLDNAQTSIVYMEPTAYQDNQPASQYLMPYYLFVGKAITTDGQQADCAFLVEAISLTEYNN